MRRPKDKDNYKTVDKRLQCVTMINMKQDEPELSERVDQRVEPELKAKVKEFANGFGMSEGWGWRLLAMKGLGDDAPNKLRRKFQYFLTGIK